MPTLATYIAFPGNAAEAFEHYADVLGGDLQLMRYGDTPPMEGVPFEPDPAAVAHAALTIPGGTIAGGDTMPGENYPLRDTAYSLLLTLDTIEEARAVIEKFVAGGGSINMPFEKAPWGDHYGQVFDRFDVMWAVNVEAAQG